MDGFVMLLVALNLVSCLVAAAFPLSLAQLPDPGTSLPFVVLHGIGDECANDGMTRFTRYISNMTGTMGYCIEIGNGASDSFFMRLDKQAELVCDQVRRIVCALVKVIPGLQAGYNLVGLSQGNLVGRAVIEWCDGGPPVFNFVSLGGPHAGIAAVPLCTVLVLCKLVDIIIKFGVYSSFVQNHFAPTGYVKIPTDLPAYYHGCLFLPKLNNELPARNLTVKQRFGALNHLVLVKFDQDSVLFPPETAWFAFYGVNDFTKVLPVQETDLYKQDWIGLKQLHEAGKVTFLSFPGNHLAISEEQIDNYIVPYLLPGLPIDVL